MEQKRFVLRDAAPEDVADIVGFIKELAVYEKMLDEVETNEELVRYYLFEKKLIGALIAEENGQKIGFALYFFNYSTFVGRAGLYLEDVFIRPAYRGKGYGKAIFRRLAQIAEQNRCGRMEWSCLDWNEPSRKFYQSLGAIEMKGWTVHRLTEKTFAALAQQGLT